MNWLPCSCCGGWQKSGNLNLPADTILSSLPPSLSTPKSTSTILNAHCLLCPTCPNGFQRTNKPCGAARTLRPWTQWDARQRNRMAVVAYALLPLFEQQPASAWNAVKRLPVGNDAALNMPTPDYLQYWRSVVDEHDMATVKLVIRSLGV